MRRLGLQDRLLLGTLLPLWIVFACLHAKEAVRTGLAEPPVYAAPSHESDGYPRIGGFRLERGRGGEALEVGDRLLSIGGVDLRGAGYLSFDAIALAVAGDSLRAPLVFERNGEVHTVELAMLQYDIPWFLIAPLLTAVVVSLLVLLRSPSRESRLLYVSVMSIALLETPFAGSSYAQSMTALLVFQLTGGLAFFFSLRWLIVFPSEVPDEARISLRWSWLGLLWYLPRIEYVFGLGIIPSDHIPQFALAFDALFLLGGLAIATHNYRRASLIGRRRFKWLLLGGYIGVLPLGIAVLAGAVFSHDVDFSSLLEIGVLMMVAFPLGILVAVARYNLFDVDRVLGAAASWSLVLVLSVAVLGALLPVLSRWLSAWSGLDPLAIQAGIGVLVVSGALPLGPRLRPTIDRVFFPERAALKRGSDELMRDLGTCKGTEDVILTLAWRIDSLLNPEFFGLYVPVARQLEAFDSHGSRAPKSFSLDGSIASVLEEHGAPLLVDAGSARRDGTDFDRRDRELLAASDCRALIPVFENQSLAALIALGPKQSGDIFTETDLAQLTAIAVRASREVQRIRDARRLEQGDAEIESLRAQKADADASNLAKSRFLATASHDLRQPLHALGLLSEALFQRLGRSEHAPLVRRINETVENLDEMMTGILDLSKLEARTVSVNVDRFALAPVLERIGREFAAQAANRGLELRVRSTGDFVRSDRLLLTRILQNLVVNGLRYTDRGGVLLGARRRGDEVFIEVWDTGRGIPESQLDVVFEEFRQLERDVRRQGPGLGLGLSIVDRLAKLLGHPIEIASRVGHGTRFRVRVPWAEAVALVPVPAALPTDVMRGRVVLVVDDEVEIREGMRALLEPWGCEVLTASSLDEAVARAKTAPRPPDVVVSDFHLGAGFATGPDTIAAVRSCVGREVPGLIVTGDTSPVSIDDLRSAGHPYLNKPVRPAKLRAMLSELLRPMD